MSRRAWIVLLALACTACGGGDAQQAREVAELRGRVLNLERRVSEPPPVPAVDWSERPFSQGQIDWFEGLKEEVGTRERLPVDEPPPVPAVDWSERPYSQEQIDWFRGLKEAAGKIERRERYVSIIRRQLDRSELDLTDEQRERIVNQTIAFRNRMRDEMRQAQERGDDRDTRQGLIEGIRNEYEQVIHDLLPSEDAAKVIESVGRYSGFGEK